MRPASASWLSRFLVGCHPRRWRERYGEEMLDVLDQHRPTARTVLNLAASVLSTHVDPAYRSQALSLPRLRRAALISAAIAVPLTVILGPVGYGIWQDDHWHPAADENLLSVAFSAHTAIMVTAFGQSIDGTDAVWDVTDLSRPRRLSQFEGGQPTALSPDGRTVATVAFSGRMALWNVADPRHPAIIATLPGSDLRHLNPSLRGQAFSPGGQILATAYYDQVVLWDVTSPARPRPLRTLDAPATSPAGNSDEVLFSPQDLVFSPDGDILASATGTDQVTLWNVTGPARAYRTADLDSPGVFTQGLAFSPSRNLLAVLTSHGTVLVYSLADPARPPGPHRHGHQPAGPREVPGRAVPARRGAVRQLRLYQRGGGVLPRRAHPDRRRRPHGDERQLRARHHLRLARDRLRDPRRRHGRRARRRRLPALHSPRRPHRAGRPG